MENFCSWNQNVSITEQSEKEFVFHTIHSSFGVIFKDDLSIGVEFSIETV